MTVVLISNYFNHHQKALSDALYRLTDGSFRFISTSQMREARKQLGYGSDPEPDYVLHLDRENAHCKELLLTVDIVIAGSAPQKVLWPRIRAGKLVFRYSERPLKNGPEWSKYIPRLLRWHWWNPPGKPVYLLCASAYTAADYARFGLFRNRCYRWGYFPEMKKHEMEDLFAEKSPRKILWAGRMLDLKHPEHAVSVAERLRDAGYSFDLTLVGMGPLEDALMQQIQAAGLQHCVHMTGALKPAQVQQHMEQSGIYLFTSNHQEGWGAVLNEAMNSGCAVVAGHAIGSVPFLLRDGENGLVYESENPDMLYEKVKYLLDHPAVQRQLGECAYRTVSEEWNAEVAAQRLLRLAEQILAKKPASGMFQAGPCSRAEIQKDEWA